jgi:sirohydrochlorin cobaltochelatase
MTEPSTGTLLLVPAQAGADCRRLAGDLAHALAGRLGPVLPCLADGHGELPFVAGIRSLVAAGAQRLVVLPLLLSPETGEGEDLSRAVQWASRRWPFLTFHRAAPLTWPEWAGLVSETARGALADLAAPPGETALLIVTAGCPGSLANADLARLAHLVRQWSDFARVDGAFLDTARPSIPDAIALLARLNVQQVVVVPWLTAPGDSLRPAVDQAEQAARACNLRVAVAVSPLAHPALIDLLTAHCQAALQDDSLLAPSWEEVMAQIAHGPGQAAAQEEAQLDELDRKINEMLPPQYQDRYDQVRPTSMGTAALRFAPDGKVAWDEMWTSFCDLALAGGPSHRGTLLEAVPAADALAEPEKYQEVVAEIERGIKLVTGLPVVPSRTVGWVGVRCDSEEMAVWLMRAIIVENVMVRREGDVLYLPAGPRFTLKREIKNVVTVIAKTCHYWTAHLAARRLTSGPGAPPCTSSTSSSSKS